MNTTRDCKGSYATELMQPRIPSTLLACVARRGPGQSQNRLITGQEDVEGAFCRPYIPPRQTVEGRRGRDVPGDTCRDNKHVKIVFGQGTGSTRTLLIPRSIQLGSCVLRRERDAPRDTPITYILKCVCVLETRYRSAYFPAALLWPKLPASLRKCCCRLRSPGMVCHFDIPVDLSPH